jgi:hypothetical protein
MEYSITPNRGPHAGVPSAEELTQLARLVRGMVDADLLLAEDGGALLRSIETARVSLDEGDLEAAHRHLRQFCQEMQALAQSGRLKETDGHAALASARRILGDA